jgi:hypothetical protein
MSEFTWQAVYASDLQSLWALFVAPLAFLAWRLAVPPNRTKAAVPSAAAFVSGLTLFFAIETMIDPIATGPLLATDALAERLIAILIPFVFVLLGDLRVILLAVGIARVEDPFGRKLLVALAISLVIPIFAGVSFGIGRWLWPTLHGQALWMLYEGGFFVLCVAASRFAVPLLLADDPVRAGFVRAVLGYSAAYYALWFSADFVIVVLGLDLGWALRIVPNQLYYAFWVPFVYFRFFGAGVPNPSR